MDLSKKIFGSNIDPKIQEYLKKLQEGSFEIQPGDPITGTSLDSKTETYLGDRTPFARMWTAVNVVEVLPIVRENGTVSSKYKPIGSGNNSVYIVNDNTLNSYEYTELDEMGSLMQEYAPSELGNNQFLKPTAGITDVSSRSEGSIGALRRTVVKFVVHNKQDFDQVFLPFFLKPGSFVFVDFGWSDKALDLYDPNDFINNSDLELGDFYEKIYNNDDKIKNGITSTLGGQVIKYDVNVNQNQSFECTLEFVSSNYQLLDKEVSEDNNLKFVFTNVLEDLLMLKYINSSAEGKGKIEDELKDSYLWNEIPREERSKNIQTFFDTNQQNTDPEKPLIDKYSKKVGIFYQNFTDKVKASKLQSKESLYVSFAVFEDDFLNNYVATTVKIDSKGNEIPIKPTQTATLPKFSSVNTYIRWDKRLFEMMKIKPRATDKVLSFLYPDSWNVGETSNKYKPNQDLYVDDAGKPNYPGNDKITKYDTDRHRIPLRELFIRTTTIIEAFQKSTNVNDALEAIFDAIFEDSYNLINIRLIKNNGLENSLTFHDINIEPIEKKPEETFVFDLTSGNTIVQNVDLKFETPKAGLSSMIAIGGLPTPQIFDDFQLMRFNILNGIQSGLGLKKQIRHLPIFGENIITKNLIDVNVEKILNSSPKLNDTYTPLQGFGEGSTYESYKTQRNEILEGLGKKRKTKQKEYYRKFNEDDDREIFEVSSEREMKLITSRIESFIKTGKNAVSPVLPISLTLEVYGNNFLNIGDYFTINFLPEHYRDRVYFQIIGVDHSISTGNWKTTYNTVMRPYSTKKFYQFGSKLGDDLAILNDKIKIILDGVFQKQLYNEFETWSYLVNEHQKHMVERMLVGNQITLELDIKDSYLDTILMQHFHAKYDINKNSEKLGTEGEDSGIQNNNKHITISHNPASNFSLERLAWYMTISNLLLSDEVIDWQYFTYNNDSKVRELRIALEEKYILEEPGRNGAIWVAPLFKDPANYTIPDQYGLLEPEERGEYYNKYILNRLQESFQSADGEFKLAREQRDQKIKNRGIGTRTNTEALEKFLFKQKQKISEHIIIPTNTGIVPNEEGQYLFLNKIDWPLLKLGYDERDENSQVNEFDLLYFGVDNSGGSTGSFTTIQIPKLFAGGPALKVSVEKLSKLIYENYAKKLSEILKAFPESKFGLSSSLEGPGLN